MYEKATFDLVILFTLWLMLPSRTPENRKQKVLWCFRGITGRLVRNGLLRKRTMYGSDEVLCYLCGMIQ